MLHIEVNNSAMCKCGELGKGTKEGFSIHLNLSCTSAPRSKAPTAIWLLPTKRMRKSRSLGHAPADAC